MMKTPVLDRWSGFVIDGERAQAAILSWFPFAPAGCRILYAEGYEADDGSTPKLRALVQLSNGKLRELFRHNNKANTKHGSKPPSETLVKRAKERGRLSLEPSHVP